MCKYIYMHACIYSSYTLEHVRLIWMHLGAWSNPVSCTENRASCMHGRSRILIKNICYIIINYIYALPLLPLLSTPVFVTMHACRRRIHAGRCSCPCTIHACLQYGRAFKYRNYSVRVRSIDLIYRRYTSIYICMHALLWLRFPASGLNSCMRVHVYVHMH